MTGEQRQHVLTQKTKLDGDIQRSSAKIAPRTLVTSETVALDALQAEVLVSSANWYNGEYALLIISKEYIRSGGARAKP